jgi:phosphinothricin acetyltransferase
MGLVLANRKAFFENRWRPRSPVTANRHNGTSSHDRKYSRRDAERRRRHSGYLRAALHSVAGYVYASQHRERAAYRWAADAAVYIADAHQRRGLGRALYTSLFAVLREHGYFQAYAGLTLPNPGSVGLHEAVGFQPVAVFPHVGYKLGRWLDVGWWRLQLRPEIKEPADPTPFSKIRADSSIAAVLAAGTPNISFG